MIIMVMVVILMVMMMVTMIMVMTMTMMMIIINNCPGNVLVSFPLPPLFLAREILRQT